MGKAQIRINPYLLAQFLKLPEGMEVVGFERHQMQPHDLVLLVTYPDIPETADGAELPELMLTYRTKTREEVELEDWKIWEPR